MELFVLGVCSGDREKVVLHISRLEQVGIEIFDIQLARNSEECQRYGGVTSITLDEAASTKDRHSVIYGFGDGSSSESQRHRTELQNGIHRVVTSDPEICDTEGCFE